MKHKNYFTILLIFWILKLPFNAIGQNYSGGNGTELNPYKISTVEDLQYLSSAVNNGNRYRNTYFLLTTDLDLKTVCGDGTNGSVSANWTPIGNYGQPFCGDFNGGGHSISGLYANGQNYVGLFGCIEASTVKRVTLVNLYVRGEDLIGGVVGAIKPYDGNSRIEGVHVIGGQVIGTALRPNIGGIVGGCFPLSGIYFDIIGSTVSGVSFSYKTQTAVATSMPFGSIIGLSRGHIIACLSVNNTFSAHEQGGAIVGENYGAISHCYFSSNINLSNGLVNNYGTINDVNTKTIAEMNNANTLAILNEALVNNGSGVVYVADNISTPTTRLRISYDLIFNPNGGVISGSSTKTITYGSAIGELPTPTKEGSHFMHWTIGDTIITPTTIWTYERPKTAEAKWYHVVTFDTDGGSTVNSINVNPGHGIQQPISPHKTGFLFFGWYKDAACTNKWEFGTDKVLTNTILYAKWVSETSEVVISFNSDGGSPVASQTITVGSLLTPPTPPTKAERVFGGWYKASNLYSTNRWDFEKDKVMENLTLYARWITKDLMFYVGFLNHDNTLISSTNVPYNSLLSRPEDPIDNDGSSVFEWIDFNRNVFWNFDKDRVTDMTTLTLRRININEQFTVSFHSNGGSSVAPQTINALQLITSPAPPTKARSVFEGWYKDILLNNAWDFNTEKITGNTTLYAKWSTATTYTVTFESNGGSAIVAQTVKANPEQLIIPPTPPTKTGYVFAGWYKDAQFTTVWNFGQDKVTESMTLYAKWTINVVNHYTVTFNSNGGSNINSITLQGNNILRRPANPIKEGYTFGSWYKDPSLTTPWNFSKDKVTNHITLYAKWITLTFKVAFASNKGTAVETITVDYNSTFDRPKNPTRSGYTFDGWYKEYTLQTPWNFNSDKVSKNTTLYAKWATPTSITKEEKLLKLYPNPATTELKIENIALTGAEIIQIFDLTGKQVLQVMPGEVIDISPLPKGIYYLKAGEYMAKFIKK